MKQKKRLAARILKTSLDKVKFDPEALGDIKKALTRSDLRGLIAIRKITSSSKSSHSRGRARKKALQKKKGRQENRGSKKGKKFSMVSRKRQWINRVRIQRRFLQLLREKGFITPQNFQQVYLKIKGGFFRNRRHMKLYLNEYHLLGQKK